MLGSSGGFFSDTKQEAQSSRRREYSDSGDESSTSTSSSSSSSKPSKASNKRPRKKETKGKKKNTQSGNTNSDTSKGEKKKHAKQSAPKKQKTCTKSEDVMCVQPLLIGGSVSVPSNNRTVPACAGLPGIPDSPYERYTSMQKALFHAQKACRLGFAAWLAFQEAPLDRERIRRLSHGKKGKRAGTALYHLYEAYTHVREYETNPPPPLMRSGMPNYRRVLDDSIYRRLMGTWRMVPNRLGVDDDVRKIWALFDIPDPNYADGDPMESEAGEDEEHGQLYGNVKSRDESPHTGPQGVMNVARYMSRLLHGDADERAAALEISGDTGPFVPASSLTSASGYSSKGSNLWTDFARAMQDIHQNVPPPKSDIPETEDLGEDTFRPSDCVLRAAGVELDTEFSFDKAATKPPEPLDDAGAASLTEPYGEDACPFTEQQLSLVEATCDSYVPVFYPTGISVGAIAEDEDAPLSAKPPYKATEATPPGIFGPNPNRTPYWDGRVSLGIFMRPRSEKEIAERAIKTAFMEQTISGLRQGTLYEDFDLITHVLTKMRQCA